MPESNDSNTVISFALKRAERQSKRDLEAVRNRSEVETAPEGSTILVPLFSAVTIFLYLEAMNRFPEAQEELKYVALSAVVRVPRPLFVEVTKQTFLQMNEVHFVEVIQSMSKKFDEVLEEQPGVV